MIQRDENFWKKKLSAILHDPLTKALNISAHEKISMDLTEKLGLEFQRGPEDTTASAMDRIPLPFERNREKQIKIEQDLEFLHPFSGEVLELVDDPSALRERLERLLFDHFENFKSMFPSDFERLYHLVWWVLPYVIPYAQLLPADTRVPNHSIVDHLDTTSALVPCVEENRVKASLIAMQIGPVQETIVQARKTRDLWAGSYLISYLMYGALEKLGLGLGFDSIIYPYLRNVSFLEETMRKEGITLPDDLVKLPKMSDKVACLPNVFVAVVPSSEADEWIKECEKAILDRWNQLAVKTKLSILQTTMDFDLDSFDRQINLFPTIVKARFDLISPDEALVKVKKFFKNSHVETYIQMLKGISELDGYAPNEGSYYNYSYRILVSKLTALKNQRLFKPYEEIRNGRILEADDFGAGVKACVEFVEVFENEEKRDLLGTVNTVKRKLPEILQKDVRYESTRDIAQRNVANEDLNAPGEDKMKNPYFAVLMMDGDEMGKWVSGEKALSVDQTLHSKVRDRLKAELPELWKKLSSRKLIQPSYHRQLSRTLGIFSSLVESVVERNEGMLVYCGGDDVLALLPADKALKCANELRKLFRGESISLEIDGHKYEAKNGILHVDNKPFAPLMGERATISAGISVVHHKFPLQVAVKLAREAEEKAKEDYGRDSFVVHFVRRSGQITEVGSKWKVGGLDVVEELEGLLSLMIELNVSRRSLYKLLSDDIQILSQDESALEKFVHYVIRRSIHGETEEKKEKVKMFANRIFTFLNNHKLCCKDSNVEKALELILAFRTMKRGDER